MLFGKEWLQREYVKCREGWGAMRAVKAYALTELIKPTQVPYFVW
jgi:hypothetical protein